MADIEKIHINNCATADSPGYAWCRGLRCGRLSPGGTALDLILQLTGRARGVKVRLVADEKKSRDRWSLVGQLACAGVDVRLNGMYSIMHNKFVVTDGSAVETGSFNYTSSAEKRMRRTRWSFRMNSVSPASIRKNLTVSGMNPCWLPPCARGWCC